MYLISVLIISSILFLAYLMRVKIYHPAVIMLVMWDGLLIFHKISLSTLYRASDRALLLLLLGIIAFCIGCLFENTIFGKVKVLIGKKTVNRPINEVNYVLNYKSIFVFALVAVILIIPSAQIAISYLRSGASLWTIRYSLGNEIINSHITSLFYSYIINPATYLMVPVSVYLLYKKERYAKTCLAMTIILLMLQVVTKAGRMMLLYMLVSIVVIFFTTSLNRKLSRRKISFFLIMFVGVFLILTWISDNRDTNFLRSLKDYSITSITFFSLKVDKFNMPYAHGSFSWYGVMSPLYNAVEFLTGNDLASAANDLIQYINKVEIVNQQGDTFNYFATAFFRFYGDGGTSCIMLFSFLWGIISTFFYKKLVADMNIRTIFCYNLIIYGIVVSVMSFIFADLGAVVSIALIYLFTRKEKKHE